MTRSTCCTAALITQFLRLCDNVVSLGCVFKLYHDKYLCRHVAYAYCACCGAAVLNCLAWERASCMLVCIDIAVVRGSLSAGFSATTRRRVHACLLEVGSNSVGVGLSAADQRRSACLSAPVQRGQGRFGR
jgi:hypothetical protein